MISPPPPAKRRWLRRSLVVAAVLVATALVLPRHTERYFSCRLCRGLREVRAWDVLGIQVVSTERDHTGAEAPSPGCPHPWWQYSRHEFRGILGIRRGVACNARMYEDGWWPLTR